MKLITSSDNQIYKTIYQLKNKKHRDKESKYIIEGPNLIVEALKTGAEITTIAFSLDYSDESIIKRFRSENIVSLTPELFNKLTDTETPQGILAVVKKIEYSAEQFFNETEKRGTNILVLDRLQDPGNIGTIIRTADAAGFLGAIVMKGTADVYSPKIVRATAGSLFRLPILYVQTPAEALEIIHSYGKSVICTSPKAEKFYYDIDMKDNAAIVIGNEGNGACEEFLNKSDEKIKIPMEGTIESLNAAVSAGIIIYESVRQRYIR